MTSSWLRSAALLLVVGCGCTDESVVPVCANSCPQDGGGNEGGAGGSGGGLAQNCLLETEERPRPVSLSGGLGFAALLLSNGRVLCWGQDSYYQCGSDYYMQSPRYARGPECMKSIEAGLSMSVGIDVAGRAMVWGPELDSSAGDGPASGPAYASSKPVEMPMDQFTSVVSGSTMLALTANQDLYVWGRVWFESLYVPTPYPAPAPVAALGEQAHCFLTVSGEVYCFGDNSFGKLALPDPEAGQFEPVLIPLQRVQALSEGLDHACAINMSGEVWCWGTNTFGAMGQPWPDVEWHPDPARVEGIPPAVAIYAGSTSSCSIDADGVAWCWTTGGTFEDKGAPPFAWQPQLRFVDITLGHTFACGLTDDERVFCEGFPAIGCGLAGGKTCFVDIDSAIDEGIPPDTGGGGT
jgi:alpha-tubulin suppressor-like RCC1 family protein